MKERNLGLDLVKTVAMLGIVALHCFSAIQPFAWYEPQYVSMPWTERWLYDLINKSVVVCVPIFFVVSGYLLGKRSEAPTWRYAVTKCYRIFRFIIIFFALYALFALVKTQFRHPAFWIGFVVDEFLNIFYEPTAFYILWFLVALAVLYLLSPLVYRLKGRNFFVFLGCCLLVQNLVFQANLTVRFEVPILNEYKIWNYLTYYLIGMAVSRYDVKLPRWTWWLIPVLFVGNMYYEIYCQRFLLKSDCQYFHASPVCVVLTTLLFILLLNYPIKKGSFIRFMSPLFLLVYVTHTNVLQLYRAKFDWLFEVPFGQVLIYLMTLVTAVALSWVLTHTPVLKRWLRI